MSAFYNDSDRGACEWTRQLIAAGLITEGVVDERPIQEIKPADLLGYTRLAFFNGIAGWDYALRLAGWPDDRPVVTASLPCQPFSSAGKGRGQADERHLWPHFFRLVRECRFECVFGEQVPAAIGKGWLDGVFGDLESEGYTCGAVVLTAAGVGAPHIRSRLYWGAHLRGEGCEGRAKHDGRVGESKQLAGDGGVVRLANAAQSGLGTNVQCDDGRKHDSSGNSKVDRLADPISLGRDGRASDARRRPVERAAAAGTSEAGDQGMADADGRQSGDGGLQRSGQHGQQPQDDGPGEWVGDAASGGRGIGGDAPRPADGGYALGSSWAGFDLMPCRDGKMRRTQSGVQPMVDGLSAELGGMWTEGYGIHPLTQAFKGRAGLLRGAGNAIVPQTAALFIRAFLETESDPSLFAAEDA